MAHALDGHKGLCKNIHGHTYHLSVTVSGRVMHKNDQPDDGMVIEFGDLKQLVKRNILDQLDHALVLKDTSVYLQQGNLAAHEKLVLTPFQPTCENLLMYFVSNLRPLLPQGLELAAMRLDETPTSYAEWLLTDQ